MALIRCVGRVPSASPARLISDVGTWTIVLPSLTSSMTTLVKSPCMGTVCIVEALGYTLPMVTRQEGTSPK